jgi:hypothetical protein
MATVREQCEKRLEGLKTLRRPMEAEWAEIARYANPNGIRLQTSDTNQRRRKGPTIYDSHAIKAFRTLTGGMTSGLSSESRPWKMLGTADEEMMEDPEVADWLADVDKRIDSFLASTNFYSAVKVGYAQMGCFGTEACIMDEHWRAGAVCHPLFIGQYWLARNDARQVDTLYRDTPMTVKQAVDQFGAAVSSRVQQAYDNGRYDQLVKIVQAIEPNPDFQFGRMDRTGKRFRSVYWDTEDSGANKLLRLSGYEEQPFWAPSWDDPGPDTWSASPAHETLADMRVLQMQAKRKGEATDWVINPEKIAPASVKLKNRPGSIVTASSVDKDSVIVPFKLEYQAIGVIGEDVQRCREAIDTGSYADLFMAITNMPGVQPRNIEEIAARNEEKLTQLGPVVTHVNRDKLQIALDRVFGIMTRGKLLPPPPEQLHGQDLKVNFISILTQLQRSIGVGQIQETVGFVGNLAAVFPEALDKIDIDAAVDEFADRKGAPQKIIRSTKDANEMRQARQQAQQTQQMMDNMPNAQAGADAARLLSETAQNAQAPLAPAGY